MFVSAKPRSISVSALVLVLASPAWAQTTPDAAAAGSSESSTVNAASNSSSGANADNRDGNPGSGQLEEIVVTAQKRAENLQKVPLSVVAIGGAALAARGISNITDLGGSVPGLQIGAELGLIEPFLRGVGATGGSASTEAKVAVYADGVYFPRLSSSFFSLRNVERVEVLKGPQGTLFGRNSTGGIISIVTKDPSHDTQVMGSLGYGNYQQVNGDVYATTGISATLAADISISGGTNDGYGKDITTGHRYEFEDSFLVRSKLLYEPTDATHIVLAGFYNWSKSSGTKGGFPGTVIGTLTEPHQTYRVEDFGYHNVIDDTDPINDFHVWSTSLHVQQDLSFARLTSISAYSHYREAFQFEGDRTPRPDFYLNDKVLIKQFTQELQLASLPGSQLSWITGFFYYNNSTGYPEVNFYSPTLFGPSGVSAPAHQKVISYAGFAQTTYEILPKLKLTGGFRYTWDKTSAVGSIFLQTSPPIFLSSLPKSTTHVEKPAFKISADYQATDTVLTYALFSRGFKSGIYNILTYNSTVATKPETIDDYEVGLKSDLFDRRVRLNAALFYYRISNPQVELLKNNTVFFSNAGGSHVKGAEFDGEVVVTPGLTGRFSATFLDSKYTDYPNAPSSVADLVNGGALPAPDVDAKGNRTPLAPKTVFNIGGDYKLQTSGGQLLLTVDYYHNSGYFYEPDNSLRQGAYNLLNGQVRFDFSKHYAVRVWGRNLLNKNYTSSGATQLGSAGYAWAAAPPRTYGAAVDFKF